MAQYGELVDTYEPEHDKIFKAMSDFFNNPSMTKIKNVNNFSVYMSKTYCLLSRECRYLVALVEKDDAHLGKKESLANLRWVSFQTRTLPDNHDLPPHSYTAKRGGILDVEINRIKVEERASIYSCKGLPLQITLLHTKKGSNDYQNKGSVIAALETYQTTVTFV